MDSKVMDTVKSIGDSFGIPFQYLYAIMMTESGGNPLAKSKAPEDSRGLFQVNTKAHVLADKNRLYDPSYNANFIMPDLKIHYLEAKAKGLNGEDTALYMERYGERPAWSNDIGIRISKYYNNYMGGKVDNTTPVVDSGVAADGESEYGESAGGGNNLLTKITDTIRMYGSYLLVFVILIFSLNMVFNTKTKESA